MPNKNRYDFLLQLIVLEKTFLGLLWIFLSAGILTLIHEDLQLFTMQVGEVLRLEPDNRFLVLVAENVVNTKASTIIGVSILGFSYSALNLVEGYGLWKRYRWAEYLTVIATALFIPFEIVAVVEEVTLLRVGVLVINILIVVFLMKHKELFPTQVSDA